MNLNQITLPSRNIEESVAFYKALGFQQIVDSEAYARFESMEGDATFSVELVGNISGSSSALIYFEVADLQKTYAELLEKGFNFTQPPTQESWLWEEARLSDPSGNKICIYNAGENRKNPPWRIKE